MGGSSPRALGLLTAVLAMALWAAAPAYGAGLGNLHLQYEGNTETTGASPPDQHHVNSYDTCPGFDGAPKLIGGGFSIDANPSTARAVSSTPYDENVGGDEYDAWRVVVDNLSTNTQLSITEHAICAKVKTPSYESKTKPSPLDKRTTVKASCSKQAHVLGGGGLETSTFPGAQTLVTTIPFDSKDKGKAPDDGWKIAVDDNGQSGQTATAWAICAKIKGLHYRTRRFATPFNESFGLEQCGGNEYIVGGGLSQTGPVGENDIVENTFDETHTAWRVMTGNPLSNSRNLTVTAICHA
jgi:hypothetical protein